MRTLALVVLSVITSLVAVVPVAYGQQTEPPDGARIASAQVSGIELSRLSPGLQEAIGKLAGTPLDRAQLRELVARIEAEQPRYAAALRVTADPDGSARVVFVTARMRDPEHQANVNAKYTVARVEIHGVPDKDLTAELRAELKALEGKPLDPDQAERLEARLKAAFPDYEIDRDTERGSQTGTIIVTFTLTKSEQSRWLRFEPLKANAVYHSDQGWGAFSDLGFGDNNFRVTPIFALDTADDLVEEYSGAGARFETRKLGTERLGASLEWTWFTQNWRTPTLVALSFNPTLPRLYDDRKSLTPQMKFALTRQLWISGGVSIVELEPLEPLDDNVLSSINNSQSANAVIGSIGYNFWSSKGGAQHGVDARFNVRSAVRELESDLEYNRYFAEAGYSFQQGPHQVRIRGMGGVIDGDAPFFERFTLGDTRTLRGWNKYDIAPAGADHMAYGSVEYTFHGLAMFLDSGSVWNQGGPREIRVSTGFGVIAGPFLMTVGFPLNTHDVRAVFAIGFQAPFIFHRF